MAASAETVLILTPVKNASRFLDSYFAGLGRLSHPAASISLGFLESDSDDDTYEQLRRTARSVAQPLRRRRALAEEFQFPDPAGFPRWTHAFQIPRRKILAKARNQLLFRALADEDWVLWLDVDVIDYPPDLIERLLATGRDIVHPHCVKRYGGPTFDLNAWRDHGRLHMEDLRGGPDLVRLDAVGGTVLLVRADIHRDGLIFPSFPYGAASPAVRRQPAGIARRAGDRGLRRHGNGYGPPMLGHAQSRSPARARVTRTLA